jgi:hypothetical protein
MEVKMSLILCGPILFGIMGVIISIQGVNGVRTRQMHWGKQLLEGDQARKRGIVALVIGLFMVALGLVTILAVRNY